MMRKCDEDRLWAMLLVGGNIGWEARRELERRYNRFLWLRRLFDPKADPVDPLAFKGAKCTE
jgi:hypothetical protein